MLSPARRTAFEILLRTERSEAFAAELLHSRHYAKLSSADHGLATDLVMGVLRWRSVLDVHIAKVSSQPLPKLDLEVLTALRLAGYQMEFLSRVPQHAAVNESVELVKQAKKSSAVAFTNAVLRKLTAKPKGKAPAAQIAQATGAADLSAVSAHPLWLVERWTKNFGLPFARGICQHDQSIPETAIRLSDPKVEAELTQAGIELAPGTLLASARRVKSGEITGTQAFREGRVAIQDEASQLVALLVGKGSRILDCCAAPGGKSRVMAEQNPQAALVAVELHAHRARLLRQLVPAKNVAVVAADIRDFQPDEPFDRVLADVPCSGTGTLSRNPEIKWRLKPADLADLARRQRDILQSAMRQVAPGGLLVYSTCSLEPEENTVVVESALAANRSFRPLDCRGELEHLRAAGELAGSDLDSLLAGPYLRILPGMHPCDGFFAAVLERV